MENPWDKKKEELRHLLRLSLMELLSKALNTKLFQRGDRFSLCTIMNVRSGKCTEDCSFCAQSSRYKTNSPVYPLKTVDEIVREAKKARESGVTRFSLVESGKGPDNQGIEDIAERIIAIKNEVDIDICASLGIMEKDALLYLKNAGLSRYHHNIETSLRHFPKVCTTHSFNDRRNTIIAAKSAGIEICSGGIIGLGEDEEDRLDMAAALSFHDVDSVPLNILVPIKGTPMESVSPISIPEILRTIAIFRLALPEKAIRLAGGREYALSDFQALAFMAGADAMLIGGYLTVRGRAVEEDLKFVEKMKDCWRKAAS
jgi:biotin synthase